MGWGREEWREGVEKVRHAKAKAVAGAARRGGAGAALSPAGAPGCGILGGEPGRAGAARRLCPISAPSLPHPDCSAQRGPGVPGWERCGLKEGRGWRAALLSPQRDTVPQRAGSAQRPTHSAATPHTALPPHTQHCRPQGCAAAGPGLRIAHLPTHARRGATRSPTPRGRSSPSSLQLCPTDERPQPDQQIPAAVIPSAAPPSVGTDRQSRLPPPTPSAPRVGRRDAAPLPAPGLRGGAAEGRAALTWCLVCGCALSLLGGCTCTSLCIVPMGVGWGYNEHNVSRANLWPGNKAAPEPQPSASAPPPPPPHVRADPPRHEALAPGAPGCRVTALTAQPGLEPPPPPPPHSPAVSRPSRIRSRTHNRSSQTDP